MPIDGAAAVALGTGNEGGGGDFGGDSGSGDSGGGDSGSEGTELSNQGSEGGEGGEGEGEQEFELDETGEPKLDAEGNKVPKQAAKPSSFKDIHAKLKEVDPAAAEAYRKTHFGYQQYQAAFPTPKEAQVAREVFDTYGGAEGIEQVANDAQQLAAESASFSKGDPNFIKQLAESDPAGFAATAPHYIRQLGISNPEAYTAALTPILNATFEQTGLTENVIKAGQIVDRIYSALEKAGDTTYLPYLDQVLGSLNKAYGVFDKYKKLGDQYGERPLTEKEKQLQLKEQSLNEKEQQTFRNTARNTVAKSMNGSIDKALSVYYKQNPKITKEQRSDLQTGVFDFINRQLDSNKKYISQMNALMQEGDVDRINNYVMQNVNKLVQTSAKTVWNRRGFGALPNQQNKGGQGNQNQSQVNLTRRPKRDDIDWQLTSEMDYMAGNAVLKGTKRKVKWNWSSQE